MKYPLPLALAGLLTLTACGSDSDDAPAAPPPPVASANLVLSGTAAVGAAAANAPVAVKCATGTGTATTAANGSYSVTITSGTAPCVIEVTNGADKLYSMAEAGAVSPATVNVTPLTTLLTWQVNGGDPAALYSNFDAAAQAKVTAGAVNAAVAQLAAALAGQVEIADLDPIKTPFAVGDATDQKLDALAAVLAAAQTDVSALGGALVANPGSADPVRNLVAPAATTCAGLKSGEYWSVEPRKPQNSLDDSQPFLIDAAALSVTFDRGTPSEDQASMTPVPGEPCRFTITGDGGVDDIVVSSSGIFAARFPENGTFESTIGVPRTTLTTAELAGSYNYVGYVQDGTKFGPFNGSLDIAVDGRISNNRNFINLIDDTQPGDDTPTRLVQRADGTYNELNLVNNVTGGSRWLPHKAANGTVTIFVIGVDDGLPGVAILRRQIPADVNAQPVGTVTPFWEMLYINTGVAAITASSISIASIDALSTPNTVTRIRPSDNRVDTRAFNTPRPGLLYRAPNSCTSGVGGPPLACGEGVFMPSQGTGFTAVSGGAPTNGFFSVSVLRP